MNQKVIFMVGPYYSGKTGYIEKQFQSGNWKREDFAVVSIDRFVEGLAKKFGTTHDAGYKALMATGDGGNGKVNPLVKITARQMLENLALGKSVIINNPNISKAVRQVYLDLIPDGVEKEAYSFTIKNFRPWLNKIKAINESTEGYKRIPLNKAFRCRKNMEIARMSEGFDYICIIESE